MPEKHRAPVFLIDCDGLSAKYIGLGEKAKLQLLLNGVVESILQYGGYYSYVGLVSTDRYTALQTQRGKAPGGAPEGDALFTEDFDYILRVAISAEDESLLSVTRRGSVDGVFKPIDLDLQADASRGSSLQSFVITASILTRNRLPLRRAVASSVSLIRSTDVEAGGWLNIMGFGANYTSNTSVKPPAQQIVLRAVAHTLMIALSRGFGVPYWSVVRDATPDRDTVSTFRENLAGIMNAQDKAALKEQLIAIVKTGGAETLYAPEDKDFLDDVMRPHLALPESTLPPRIGWNIVMRGFPRDLEPQLHAIVSHASGGRVVLAGNRYTLNAQDVKDGKKLTDKISRLIRERLDLDCSLFMPKTRVLIVTNASAYSQPWEPVSPTGDKIASTP